MEKKLVVFVISFPVMCLHGNDDLKLLQVELEQLEVRFHGNQCRLVEKGKERTVYHVEFVPTDPQWVSEQVGEKEGIQ